MKNNYQQILKTGIGLLSAAFAVLIISSCASNKPYGEGFDVPYPHPGLSSFTSSAMIGTDITINGSNLAEVVQVFIGTNTPTISSKNANQIIATLPRVLTRGQLTLTNSFQLSATSSTYFEPQYPSLTVTGWPSIIYKGTSIKLEGENVDQIKEITVNGNKVTVDGSNGSSTSINVSLASITLAENSAVIKITASYGGFPSDLQTSPSIPVKDPSSDWDPVEPIVLFDFEDGISHVDAGDITPDANTSNSDNLQKGRGAKFLTVKATNVADQWGTLIGSITKTGPIDMSEMRDPYLSFLVNTNGQHGYAQLEASQGGVTSGGHFTSSTSSNPNDNYDFVTDGWEWRSVSLKNWNWEDWGQGKLVFDGSVPLDFLRLSFKQGNGGNNGNKSFQINLDQIMITDGRMDKGTMLVYNFEDNVNPYSGSANSAINGNTAIVNDEGDKYLTVTNAATGNWSWTGAASTDNGALGYDISTYTRTPYLNIWVNTGANSGFVQLFVGQGTQQFVYSDPGNVFQTDGEWKRLSIKLTSDKFSVDQYYPGYVAGSTFDSKQKIKYVQIGFTTGTTPAAYEISIDDINISDGPNF